MQKVVTLALLGQSDRLADILAEKLVEEFTKRDVQTRCCLQVSVGTGMIMVSGQVHSRADFDVSEVVRQMALDITGNDDLEPFVHIDQIATAGFGEPQWPTLAPAVAYGYATRETAAQLPWVLGTAQDFVRRFYDFRSVGRGQSWLGSNGQIQISATGKTLNGVHIIADTVNQIEANDARQLIYQDLVVGHFGEDHGAQVTIELPQEERGFRYSGASGKQTNSMLYGGLMPDNSASFTGRDIYDPQRLGVYAARQAAKELLKVTDAPNVLVQLVYTHNDRPPVTMAAVSGTGENLDHLLKDMDFRPQFLVEKFDLAKLPLGTVASHHQFMHEIWPWEL